MASLEAGKKENYVSSSDSEGENVGERSPLPRPTYDGLPQV